MTRQEFIYTITCTANGKVYVGRTRDHKRRKNDHFRHLRYGKHINKNLQYSFNKHGEKCFVFQVIEAAPVEMIKDRELFYFEKLKADGVVLFNYKIVDASGGVDAKSEKTRGFIFDVLDIKYWAMLSVKDTANRFGLSTATVLLYTPEWEKLRNRRMIRQVQTEATLKRMALFVQKFREIGREAYRQLDDFKLSHQAVVKHLPKFGLTFDDVRLDGDFKTAGRRAEAALADYKNGVDMKEACNKHNISIQTFYKYRNLALS